MQNQRKTVWVWLIISSDSKLDYVKSGLIPKGTMHYSQIVLIVHKKKNDGASYMKMMIVFCQHILLTISEKIDCLAMKIWYTIQKSDLFC